MPPTTTTPVQPDLVPPGDVTEPTDATAAAPAALSGMEADAGVAPGPAKAGTAVFTAPAPSPAVENVPAGAVQTAGQVAQQIVQRANLAQVAAGRTVHLRLQPDGLGNMDLRLHVSAGGRVTLNVAVDRPETARLVLAGIPELQSALRSHGLSTDQISLSMAPALPIHASGARAPTPSAGSGAGGWGSGGQQTPHQPPQDRRQGEAWGATPPEPSPEDGFATAVDHAVHSTAPTW